MCEPISMGIMMAASTWYQINEQKAQIKDTNTFNAQQAAKVRASANRAAELKNKAVIGRRVQLREQASAEVQDISRQAIKASGLTRLEGAGASVGAVLASIASQEIIGKSQVERGQEFGDFQDQVEFSATAEQAYGRALAAERAPILAPNLLGSVLRVSAAGFSAYMAGKAAAKPSDAAPVSAPAVTTTSSAPNNYSQPNYGGAII
jgi:hypothetical protein